MNIRLLECSMFVCILLESGNAISLDKKGILIDPFSIEMYKCTVIDNSISLNMLLCLERKEERGEIRLG